MATRNIGSLKSEHVTQTTLKDMGIKESDIFDHSLTPDDLYSIPLTKGLTPEEQKDANVWKRFYYGVMMVTGNPGGGKGVFTIVLMHKMKRLFGRKIMLDYKPRELFGLYVPFTENIFMGELDRMREVAMVKEEGVNVKELKPVAKLKASDKQALASTWLASTGQVFLQGAAMALDELKKYFHNRRPHNPMGVMLGNVVTIYRHMDLLLVGMTPFEREIDQISFMPYVTHRVICSQRTDKKIQCDIYQTVWVSNRGVLQARLRPFRMVLDPFKPRPELGGARYVDLYNSKDPKALNITGRKLERHEE